MKTVLALIAMMGLTASVSAAETINLGPVGCGLTRYCVPQTDTGDVVTLSAAYGNFTHLSVNGVDYASTGQVYLNDYLSFPLYAADGSQVLLTASFSTFRTCTKSGRGQHCSLHWNLTGGSVVL